MENKRTSIGKKTRFEVFKRDSFTCQYCGQKAPDVILEVDHISPVSRGGTGDILNLITACWDCNSGKGARELSDNTVIARQREQLEALNERRDQLEMMLKWREGLASIDEQALDALQAAVVAKIPGFSVNESGRKTLRDLMRRFGIEKVLAAVDISAERYLVRGTDGNLNTETVQQFFTKIGGVAWLNSRPQQEQELRYVLGILRRRFSYMNERTAMQLLGQACDAGFSIESLKGIAKVHSYWSTWRDEMIALVNDDG